MEKTILLTANYKGRPLEIVRGLVPAGFSLRTMESASQVELEELAGCADYILASGKLRISESVVNNAPKLKMVQRLGVGLDSLDFAALGSRDIPVYVNKGVNADSVAEHAVMFMLAALRHLTIINSNTKNGIWKKQEQGVTTRELSTQTIGIVGCGNIGRKVAAILKGFGCKVLYYEISRLDPEVEKDLNIEYKGFEELIELSDIITLHCALTKQTEGLICERTIEQMKDGAIIVNTSRGGLINEVDLKQALDSGRISFAALDVFCEEPIKNFSLVQHEHVICTPHIAGNTYDSFTKMMELAFANISLFEQGELAAIENNRIDMC